MLYRKIHSVLFLIGLFLLNSCVDDDVCDKGTTPKMILKFIDSSEQPFKIDTLYIDKVNTDGTMSNLGLFIQADSLSVPLNSLSDVTKFYFYNRSNTEDTGKDIITVKYNTDTEYVSKACGLKIIFKNVTYDLNQSVKIKKITANTTEINDESKNNLYITY